VHHGRIVKRTGDGSIIEFRSVVDAVNCAIEVQRAMVERNAEVAPEIRVVHAGRETAIQAQTAPFRSEGAESGSGCDARRLSTGRSIRA
jgi:hypothetical protein